jgi:hypothetical protein
VHHILILFALGGLLGCSLPSPPTADGPSPEPVESAVETTATKETKEPVLQEEAPPGEPPSEEQPQATSRVVEGELRGRPAGDGGLGKRGLGIGASSSQMRLGAHVRAAAVTGGDPVILGALAKSSVEDVVQRSMTQILYCYQHELDKNPELKGETAAAFVIDKRGIVSSADVKPGTLGNEVEECVEGRFRRMRFPAPEDGGTVTVSQTLSFDPGA